MEKGNKFNNKIDIYSLGCLIYELFTLNEYYIDSKIEGKNVQINLEIYDQKWQDLINLLLNQDYHKRPNIEDVYNLVISIKNEIKLPLENNNINLEEKHENYIVAEIDIKEKYINESIRIINSYEDNKYNNEDKTEIKINDEIIPFTYFLKFNTKRKYIIKYLFMNNPNKINYMFANCELLTYIDLSNFNSQNIIDMECMFLGCTSLKIIDFSNFYTQKVTNIYGLFNRCSSLISINLSNFFTDNVTDLSYMFYEFKSLINLDLSNFITNNVISMREMFSGCASLKTINLSNFFTNNVRDISNMFSGCFSLTNIPFVKFDIQIENPLILYPLKLKYKKLPQKLSELCMKSKNINPIFNIISFLNKNEIMELIQTKNKKIMTLINKSLIDSYYHEIRFYLEGYRDFIEPLKYILKYTYNQKNSSLKIDLKVIIRFIDKKNKILPQNPKHFQLLYKLSFLSKDHKLIKIKNICLIVQF